VAARDPAGDQITVMVENTAGRLRYCECRRGMCQTARRRGQSCPRPQPPWGASGEVRKSAMKSATRTATEILASLPAPRYEAYSAHIYISIYIYIYIWRRRLVPQLPYSATGFRAVQREEIEVARRCPAETPMARCFLCGLSGRDMAMQYLVIDRSDARGWCFPGGLSRPGPGNGP
jgi:hypothetical protein